MLEIADRQYNLWILKGPNFPREEGASAGVGVQPPNQQFSTKNLRVYPKNGVLKMNINIQKHFPSKLVISKLKRRFTRFALWIIGLGISIYHITHALNQALQTKVTTGELSVVKKLKICVTDATTDVATILSDAGFTGKIALSAFFGYFWNHPFITIILIVTTYEACKNFNKAIKFVKRLIKNRRSKL